MLEGFYTLGNHLQIQLVRQQDDRLHDGEVVVVGGQAGDKGAVYLQYVQRQAFFGGLALTAMFLTSLPCLAQGPLTPSGGRSPR